MIPAVLQFRKIGAIHFERPTAGKSTVLSVNWTARVFDDIVVLPSRKLDRFFFSQMVQKGGAGNGGDAELWLGTIEKGKKMAAA